MKECSTPSVLREIQSKMRYYVTPSRAAVIEMTGHLKCWWKCGETGTLTYCWWESYVVQTLWRTLSQFLMESNMHLPYDQAITLLDICPQ